MQTRLIVQRKRKWEMQLGCDVGKRTADDDGGGVIANMIEHLLLEDALARKQRALGQRSRDCRLGHQDTPSRHAVELTRGGEGVDLEVCYRPPKCTGMVR